MGVVLLRKGRERTRGSLIRYFLKVLVRGKRRERVAGGRACCEGLMSSGVRRGTRGEEKQ